MQTFLTPVLGSAPNASDGNKLRIGGAKLIADLTELYAYVVSLAAAVAGAVTMDTVMRSNRSESCNGGVGQVITYSAPFQNVRPIIDDYEGHGIEVTAFSANGFTITSGEAGNFGYITLVEI